MGRGRPEEGGDATLGEKLAVRVVDDQGACEEEEDDEAVTIRKTAPRPLVLPKVLLLALLSAATTRCSSCGSRWRFPARRASNSRAARRKRSTRSKARCCCR